MSSRVPVTAAQRALVADAIAASQRAQTQLLALVNTLAAGHVPDGWTLTALEDDALVFEAPDAG
jgi:hypothetical protein